MPQPSASAIPDLFWVTWSILVPNSHLDMWLHRKLLGEKVRHLGEVKEKPSCCCWGGFAAPHTTFPCSCSSSASCWAAGTPAWALLARLSVCLPVGVPFRECSSLVSWQDFSDAWDVTSLWQWALLLDGVGVVSSAPSKVTRVIFLKWPGKGQVNGGERTEADSLLVPLSWLFSGGSLHNPSLMETKSLKCWDLGNSWMDLTFSFQSKN